jgi:hypothetical protein
VGAGGGHSGHALDAAGMRPPRGNGCLSAVGAALRARAKEEARGWARPRERQGAGTRTTGPASAIGPQVGRRPGKAENSFFFYKSNSRFSKSFQIRILKMKKAFSKVDPKTKVVQNLILYKFDLRHFLKFQTYFELKIQSPFFN